MTDEIFDFSAIFNRIAAAFQAGEDGVGAYLAELGSVKTTALILFLMTLVLAMCLILVWYVKSVVASIQRERMLEREYRAKIDNRLDKKLAPGEETGGENVRTIDKSELETPGNRRSKPGKNALPLDFDWKKSAVKTGKEAKIPAPDVFQYQFKPQKLVTLTALIMDMLERSVDEPKIAQTIMYKNQHLNSEDDIIQTITAIKFFIYLCVNGRFQNLNLHKTLPQEDAALFHLANGDSSLALVLMEELIDRKIAKIRLMGEGRERDKAWCEASNCATIFGSLAALSHNRLAAAAFELAIEMNPRNVTAWGRLGDMYFREDMQEKAVWAFSNVLNIADEGIYTQQIANANKMMASYYGEIGSRDIAVAMLKSANSFYDSIGVNRPLTEQEVKIVDLIETKQFENVEKIIDNLFTSKNFRQNGYL